jgi:hypothetical protein
VSVLWLQPLAWWGLGLLALPIVIHLLARHRSRRMRFPSLRFLPVARMAALRRRVLTDWPLLAVRLLILAVAVAASAAPVFVSDARREAWDRRVARAIIIASPAPAGEIQSIAAEEADASYASEEFAALTVPDALGDALRWLDTQPPAAREIVVVGDLREGALAAHDLARIPSYVGIRFLPVVTVDDRRAVEWRVVADGSGAVSTNYVVSVMPDLARTRARYATADATTPPRIRVAAGAADQAHADAVLRAVLREGLVLGQSVDRAVTIAFAGAPLPSLDQLAPPTQAWMRTALEQMPEVRGGELDGGLVVRTNLPVTDPRSARLVSDVLAGTFEESRLNLEPRRISAAALAAWSRPPGGSPPDVLPADEGDRRWFWGAALVLIALEQVMRRRRRAA